MSENSYNWAQQQPTQQAQPQQAQPQPVQPQYRWKQSKAEELKSRLSELEAQIRELKRRKAENDFAASMMAEGDNSAYQSLLSSRRASEAADAARAENARAADAAARENAEAAIDDALKQYRELYTGFQRMTPDEQKRAKISGDYLRKKIETLGRKYEIQIPDLDGIENPQTEGPTLDGLLLEIRRKAEAGTLTDADVEAFKTEVQGMGGSFADYDNAMKEISDFETVESKKTREDKAAKARTRERRRREILLKYKKAEIAGDYDAMDEAIDEWKEAGFTGRPQ